jgi:CBS-domain-containing membrane protein
MTGDSEGTGVAEAADAVPKGGRPGRSPLRGMARRVVAVCAGSGAIALLGLLGWPTRDPFVYPPIGASAFMIFSMPTVAAAAPRNAICGQACGVAGGITAPAIFGLLNRHEGLTASMSGPRLGATAAALLLATALMLGLKVSHPAAGATALLIGLGVVTHPANGWNSLGPSC